MSSSDPTALPASGAPPGPLRPWSTSAQRRPGLLPSVTAGRVLAGLLIASAWFFLFAYAPYRLVLLLNAQGLATPLSAQTALVIGSILAVLAGVRHVTKPTVLWGPATVLAAVTGLAYIVLLLQHPLLTVGFGSSASISLVYRTLLLVLAIAPILRIVSGAVATAEDVLRPGERVRIQFA